MSDERRSISRRGVRISEGDIDRLNSLLVPRIKKGQPLAHIYATHRDEIPVALRTLYNYVDIGILKVKNIDLRRKVRYRRRKKEKEHKDFIQEYHKGRTYDDFLVFVRDLPKGKSFKDLTQEDLTLLMNHINSVKRHSLGGKSPFELVDENDKDTKLLMEKLKMHPIPADEVHLTKNLLK